MEFGDISGFTSSIKQLLYDYFPKMEGEYLSNWKVMQNKYEKHPNTPYHVRDVALGQNPVVYINDNIISFDIGNDFAERKYPYYHILEDSPVIRKRKKGDEKTKGSQVKIALMSRRDFAIVSWNGKTFSKEYQKNVRGKRKKVVDNSTRYVDGQKINLEAESYENVHYHYIEKILDSPMLSNVAQAFGLKQIRKMDSGLIDDYLTSNFSMDNSSYSSVIDYINNILEL